MNQKIKIFGIALLAVLALAIVGAGVAVAQSSTPNNGFGWMMGGTGQTGYGPGMMGGHGGMMDAYAQKGETWEGMNSMHQWMNTSGGMHTFVWDSLAETLGLTSDELTAEVNAGKTIAGIAEEQGISRTDLLVTLETAHTDSLAQAVSDGYLTREQADSLLAQMDGRYEWMLDNLGSATGMLGAGGGCHANLNSGTSDQLPRP